MDSRRRVNSAVGRRSFSYTVMTPVFSTLIFLLQQQFSGEPPNPEGAKGNIIAIIALVVSTITLGVVVLQLYLSWPPRRVTKMRAKTRKHKRVSHRTTPNKSLDASGGSASRN